MIYMDIYKLWTVPDSPPKYTDCFIVLSYAVENARIPTVPTQVAIRLAYTWWKKNPTAKIIMSTGDNQKLGVTNSRVMARYAGKLGIPERLVLEEDRSKTTYENLIFSKQIADRHNLKHITLVMYDLHVRRTLAIARKLGWQEYNWISVSGRGSPAYGIKRFQTYSRLTIFIYEILAYFYNRIRGEL